MVIRRDGDGALAIGQPSHAWLSGQLSRAWGNERFGAVEPWEEVCLAAEQHDVGMAAWDLSPTLNPGTGLPHSFIEMPLEQHIELWEAAPRLLVAQSRYAAMLVSMHGTALYGLRDLDALPAGQAARVREYFASQRALQEELLAALRADPEAAGDASDERVRRNQRLLWTWDFLSLALCLDWTPCPAKDVPVAGKPGSGPGTEAGVETEESLETLELAPVEDEPGSFTLDPWPLAAGQVQLRCEGRRLTGTFSDEAEMRAALDRAPWETVRFELTPL